MNDHSSEYAFNVLACASDVRCAWPLLLRQWRWIDSTTGAILSEFRELYMGAGQFVTHEGRASIIVISLTGGNRSIRMNTPQTVELETRPHGCDVY